MTDINCKEVQMTDINCKEVQMTDINCKEVQMTDINCKALQMTDINCKALQMTQSFCPETERLATPANSHYKQSNPKLTPLVNEGGIPVSGYFAYGWHPIIAKTPDRGAKVQWRTLQYNLSPEQIEQRWADPDQLIGVRFGKFTRYLMLDIDRGSQWHPSNGQGFGDVLAALEDIGIVAHVAVQSSWSTGIHLYFPLPTEVPSFKLAVTVKAALERAGIQLAPGQLEAFPNVKSFGSKYNGHRLPLQPGAGSFLLDEAGNIETDSFAAFAQAWEWGAARQDIEILEEAIAGAKGPGRAGSFAVWISEVESRIQTGWTGLQQSNNLIGDVATWGRVKLHLAGEELIAWAVQKCRSMPGFYEFSQHQGDIWRRCRDWAAWAMKKRWPEGEKCPTGSQQADPKSKAASTQQRILNAAQQLQEQTFASLNERIRSLQELCGAAKNTLLKYRSLWDPTFSGPNTGGLDSSIEPPSNPDRVKDREIINTKCMNGGSSSQLLTPLLHPSPYKTGLFEKARLSLIENDPLLAPAIPPKMRPKPKGFKAISSNEPDPPRDPVTWRRGLADIAQTLAALGIPAHLKSPRFIPEGGQP